MEIFYQLNNRFTGKGLREKKLSFIFFEEILSFPKLYKNWLKQIIPYIFIFLNSVVGKKF